MLRKNSIPLGLAAITAPADGRGTMSAWSTFDWRDALVVVQPATMIRWHRAGGRLLGE